MMMRPGSVIEVRAFVLSNSNSKLLVVLMPIVIDWLMIQSHPPDTVNCLVSTVCGDGKAVSRDGVGRAAGLNQPFSICWSSDGESLLFTEMDGSDRVRQFFPRVDGMICRVRFLDTF